MALFEGNSIRVRNDVVWRRNQVVQIRGSPIPQCNERGEAGHKQHCCMSDAWIFDLDGVVWRGAVSIPGSLDTISRLRNRGDRVLFASNNSSMTIAAYQAKFNGFGLLVAPEDIVTSAQGASTLVLPGERVLVVGGPGIVEALGERGAEATLASNVAPKVEDGADLGPFDVVMVGLDIEFEYRRFKIAVRALLDGARLVATNEDPTYPAADGMNPGGGSIAMAIAYASGQTPVFGGKPHAAMGDLISKRLGGRTASAMIGDQPLTDGGLATTMNLPFWMVLSGVASTAEGVVPLPTRVAIDVQSLFADD
jgi:HAD superfamily hydrolase (TIGR01450 family)